MATLQQLVIVLKDLFLGRHVTIHVRSHTDSVNAYDHPETIGWGEMLVDSQGNISIKVSNKDANVLWYQNEIVLFLHGHVYFGRFKINKSHKYAQVSETVTLSLLPIE